MTAMVNSTVSLSVPHCTVCQDSCLWVRLALGSLRHGHWAQRKAAQHQAGTAQVATTTSGELTPQEMKGNGLSPGSWTRDPLW